jgi:pimeloyl-ACP methyl ester carboxylesterase
LNLPLPRRQGRAKDCSTSSSNPMMEGPWRTRMISKLKEFRRPVRIIFGDADPSLNSGVARTFHEFLPGSELFSMPGARHFVQLDEPEQVARLILAMPRPRSTPASPAPTR